MFSTGLLLEIVQKLDITVHENDWSNKITHIWQLKVQKLHTTKSILIATDLLFCLPLKMQITQCLINDRLSLTLLLPVIKTWSNSHSYRNHQVSRK